MKNAIFLIFLAACASDGRRESPQADAGTGTPVKAEAFNKKPKLKYSRATDFYATKASPGNALAAETAGRQGKAEALEAAGKDPLGAMMLACYRRDFTQGFSLAEAMFDTHQTLPTYWNQVATCHLLQGNERKALLFYNKALETTPGYVPSLNNIGVMYGKEGHDQKALVALQKALDGGRFTKTPRYNLAFLLLRYGIAEEALSHFRALSADAPQDAELRAGAANALVLLQRWPEAWQEFSQVPDKLRRRSDVGVNMALTAHRLGKAQEARAIFEDTDLDGVDRAYASAVRNIVGN